MAPIRIPSTGYRNNGQTERSTWHADRATPALRRFDRIDRTIGRPAAPDRAGGVKADAVADIDPPFIEDRLEEPERWDGLS